MVEGQLTGNHRRPKTPDEASSKTIMIPLHMSIPRGVRKVRNHIGSVNFFNGLSHTHPPPHFLSKKGYCSQIRKMDAKYGNLLEIHIQNIVHGAWCNQGHNSNNIGTSLVGHDWDNASSKGQLQS